jgi:hypothetical protein
MLTEKTTRFYRNLAIIRYSAENPLYGISKALLGENAVRTST